MTSDELITQEVRVKAGIAIKERLRKLVRMQELTKGGNGILFSVCEEGVSFQNTPTLRTHSHDNGYSNHITGADDLLLRSFMRVAIANEIEKAKADLAAI